MSEPATPEDAVSVVIVDDHALFRRGVRAELESLARRTVSVVGEAGSVDEAVAVIGHRRPDVVLLDVHMPTAVAPRYSPAPGRTTRTSCSSRCRCPTPPRTSSR